MEDERIEERPMLNEKDMEFISNKVEEWLRHPKIDGHFTKVEEITKMKRETLLSLLLVGAIAAFVVSSWLSILCGIGGLILPAIKSIKAITSGNNLDHWVKYWMIYATVSLADSLDFIPYYHLLKAFFLIYLSVSSTAVDRLFAAYVGPAVSEVERHLTPYLPQSILDEVEKKNE